jgi:hypothetical protein
VNRRPPAPCSDDIDRVVTIIRDAGGAAISRPELALRTGLCDRIVREALELAVLAGHPIIPERRFGGYRWPRDKRDADREVRSLRSHGTRMFERAAALERAFAPEQQELFA